MDRDDPVSGEMSANIGRLLSEAGVPGSMLEEMYRNPVLVREVVETIMHASTLVFELPKQPHEAGLKRFVARLVSMGNLYDGGVSLSVNEVERLRHAMSRLDAQAVKALVLHYGLEDGKSVTIDRIAEALRLEAQDVTGILASAMLAITHALHVSTQPEDDPLTG